MSEVTNILLNVSYADNGKVSQLNDSMRLMYPGRYASYYALKELHECSDAWGGSKYPECWLWGGAFNHLDLSLYVRILLSVEWERPDDLQLFVMRQWETTFTVLTVAAMQTLLAEGELLPT